MGIKNTRKRTDVRNAHCFAKGDSKSPLSLGILAFQN
jgi:hypothetical protein